VSDEQKWWGVFDDTTTRTAGMLLAVFRYKEAAFEWAFAKIEPFVVREVPRPQIGWGGDSSSHHRRRR
jgi:hypothetical protein